MKNIQPAVGALLCSMGLGGCANQATEQRPNILFILSDDHAVNTIGSYGMRLAEYANTPNIDQLASEGMLFHEAFCGNAISTPSRASFVTGKHSHKNGVYQLNVAMPSQNTFLTYLHDAGYQTALYGKWHLKSLPEGVDDYKVFEKQGHYWDPEYYETGSDEVVQYKGWCDDLAAQFTIDFLENRDKSKPFLACCHFKSIHDPWETRAPHDTLYQNTFIPEPENLCDDYAGRVNAAHITSLKLEAIDQKTYVHDTLPAGTPICEKREFVYQQYIKSYLRGVSVVDENIGKLLTYLKENGLDENTIVIYSSDQGHFLGEHGFFSKRFMYDESMQFPLIIRNPKIKNAGVVDTHLVSNIDVAPTIMEFAGLDVPEDMQGESLLPLLKQEDVEWRDALYYRYWQHMLHREVTAHYGVRTADYKLIYFNGKSCGHTDFADVAPEWELYNLKDDPDEMNNLYNNPAYAPQVSELKETLRELRIQYDDNVDNF